MKENAATHCLMLLLFIHLKIMSDLFLVRVSLSHVAPPAGRICSVKNGGCSHVCVDEAWGALCACPVGYKLSSNGAVCKGVWSMKMTLFSFI